MRNIICNGARVSRVATLLLALSAGSLLAQSPGRQVQTPDSLRMPPQAPSPALHAPVSRTAKQPPTSAAVLPLTPGSPLPPAPAVKKASPDSLLAPAQFAAPSPPPTHATSPLPRASVSPGPRPAGATMQCKDGTYLSGPVQPTACDAHQGLAVVFPVHPGASTPSAIP